MSRIRRIVYATDESRIAHRAAPYAAELARRSNAVLHIIEAVVPHKQAAEGVAGDFPAAPEQLAEWFRVAESKATGDAEGADKTSRALHEADEARVLREQESVVDDVTVVQVQMQSPSTPMAILSYAQQQEADLLVVGTHGRSGVERVVSGSVAESVVRLAERPVLVVGPDVGPLQQPAFERVVAAIDFSHVSEQAVRWAAHMANVYEADLHLLHVMEQAQLPPVYGLEPMPADLSMVEEPATTALQELAREVVPTSIPVNMVLQNGGTPHDVIAAYTEDSPACLLVMNTHGRSGFRRLLLGSVTEKVLRSSCCPVLAVRTPGT